MYVRYGLEMEEIKKIDEQRSTNESKNSNK